jgi:hypothetical protein
MYSTASEKLTYSRRASPILGLSAEAGRRAMSSSLRRKLEGKSHRRPCTDGESSEKRTPASAASAVGDVKNTGGMGAHLKSGRAWF